MNNKKGVSLISLTITIIVLIILAGITIGSGFGNIEKTQKAAFLSDFGNALENLRTYNQRAEAFSTIRYNRRKLTWDGFTERATNTAKLEDNQNEDRVDYIFHNTITNNLIGKLEIRSGDLYIKEGYTTELEWAKEIHDYMNVLDN